MRDVTRPIDLLLQHYERGQTGVMRCFTYDDTGAGGRTDLEFLDWKDTPHRLLWCFFYSIRSNSNLTFLSIPSQPAITDLFIDFALMSQHANAG